ncbi:hypothetical protein HWC44_gp085 [Mycobacterium phage ThetaBob]|uniref:Uncharacterized protein n=1 Tax=Mycobacterium phage ThetaBob TaxID=2588513 RepID=A0A4Y6ENB7_9CAUD|nr:hypothetical protein HWC44_gp085 [Mycobacterium phage ThetaBob]QDF19972.1 hypothetical protein SEA_THETABOB_85 [Mycobacterium phage ThetaBob]
MSSEAQNLIADVMGKHRLERGVRMGRVRRVEWWVCLECGWESEKFDLNDPEVAREIEQVKRAHVAEEVDKALGGLTRFRREFDEWNLPVNHVRWESGWSEA